ncbi:MAG: carboxypeptidase-like regulatory domain-containing protein [Vicinamibacterales bacterium]
MRAPALVSLAVGILLVLPTFTSAQAPSISQGATQPGPQAPRMTMPPRDGSVPNAPTGTARIRGRVVAADTGAPLRRAQVRVMSPEVRAGRSVTTDADGRFEVTDLPAGRYSLTVGRNGYVSLQFGQQRPFEPGRPLELANGQLIERVDFSLPRGSVISGRITDELGEPMAGVQMQAMRHRYLPTGERQLIPANIGGMFSMVTNDLGEFRVFGLMPGTYVLSANPDDGGMMSMAGGVMPGNPAGGDSDGYVTTYYPGTLSAEQAQPINVGVADVASVSFALSTARMTRISGVVRNSQGRPIGGARLMIRSRTPAGGFMRGLPPIGPDGQFSIANVPPGEYSLEVSPMAFGGANAGPESDEVASIPVTAAGRDITDLIITTTPGATITGRVIYEGASQAERPARVTVQSPEPGSGMMFRPTGDNGVIDATGRFQLRSVTGRALFRTMYMSAPSIGWGLKSVTLNGADITDTPLDVASLGDVSGIEITLTDTLSMLSGSVTNAQRAPVKDYVVVILPDRLREGALPQRFTRAIRPDQDGRYQTRGLPAGDYLAVALSALEAGDEWDPAFRKQIEPIAKRFRLMDGQTATVDLQLVR